MQELSTIIYVRDLELVSNFYRQVLKLQVFDETPNYSRFRLGPNLLTICKDRETPASGGSTRLAILVPDLTDAMEKVTAQAAQVVESPMERASGKQATVCDPEGNLIDLIESKASHHPISADTVVNSVLLKSPEAMGVLEDHGIRICGGCIVLLNGTVQETAEYSGLAPAETAELVEELNSSVNPLDSTEGLNPPEEHTA